MALPEDEYLDAREAAELLGVKLPTLYAYASRGLVRSEAGASGRERRYRRAEVERLLARRARAAGPAAAGALRFGEPVLDSSITRIDEAGPSYRGRSAIQLATGGTSFEATAELLWNGQLPARRPAWKRGPLALPLEVLPELIAPGTEPLGCLQLVLPCLALADPGRFDAEPAAVLERARKLIPVMAASLGLPRDPRLVPAALEAESVAEILALALGAATDAATLALLDAALVLLADHELNASTFAARVAASTGTDLYACLSAALAALAGPSHGGASERVEALVREVERPENAERAVHERMRRGARIPGFGQPLYPGGDPRAEPLLAAAERLAPSSQGIRTLRAVAAAMRAAGRPEPNLDVAITAVTAALELPPGMGPALFAVGRSAGWVAHVLEQQASGELLRPRARYRGAD